MTNLSAQVQAVYSALCRQYEGARPEMETTVTFPGLPAIVPSARRFVRGMVLEHLPGLVAFPVQLRAGQAEPGDGAVAGAHQCRGTCDSQL